MFQTIHFVTYYADNEARKAFDRTTENFTGDDSYHEALRRAAELGKTKRWVKFGAYGFADNDHYYATFGTDVTHAVARQKYDRRGEYHCYCGAWLADENDRDAHWRLAGWMP